MCSRHPCARIHTLTLALLHQATHLKLRFIAGDVARIVDPKVGTVWVLGIVWLQSRVSAWHVCRLSQSTLEYVMRKRFVVVSPGSLIKFHVAGEEYQVCAPRGVVVRHAR
jgi:hypothetical protein